MIRPIPPLATALPLFAALLLPLTASGQKQKGSPVKTQQEALIPKRETGVLEFLKKHPEFDGRDVTIAIFDTGVDPAADGLQKTSTGERKIVDVIDATGTGDVDTSHTAEASKENTLEGLTGRTLTLPKKLKNPSGTYHLGIKRASDLFSGGVMRRINQLRLQEWQRQLGQIRDQRADERRAAEKKGERAAFRKAAEDRTLEEKNTVAREQLLESLEQAYAASDPGPVYDCVLWSDGKQFHVIVDTDEDGDLNDEKVLRPFGIAGEYGTLGEEEAATFAVQVYEEGNLLSIVTVNGSHGSHVAAIASAHFPDEPHRDGVAPGAKILSIKIGDMRLSGGSSGVGEMRGVAACAQYGVDIANASWGGASQFQDGKHLTARIYNQLVEKYGVTTFISAGNSGPALSTLGSPGGDTSSVIGVGAYVSSEMARVLYSQTTEAPSTAYNFSARGPAKNGDLGVDVMGPGGAHASLAYDGLRKSQRYHGTSMSAPSVTGVGALLVSAAKQSKIDHSPARIRSALMNSARFVDEVEVFAQGAGLVQTLPAWEHLKANAEQAAWDHFFTVETGDNTFRNGPGLYLRGDIPAGPREVRFDISPKFIDRVSAPEKFALEDDLVFTATQPWVNVPGYARLGNGRITLRPILDIPRTRPGQPPLYAEIHGKLAGSPDAGPLVRIPITIIRGEKTEAQHRHRASYTLKIDAGDTDRHFFQVPENASHLKLRLRRTTPGSLPRVVVLHAYTPVSDSGYYHLNTMEYFGLSAGAEVGKLIPVESGKTIEIALHQPYFSVGSTEIDAAIEFVGLDSHQELLMFHENDKHVPLRVTSVSNLSVTGEGTIDQAHFSKLPEKTEFLSPDKRESFPPGPRQDEAQSPPFLRQTFSISVDKPTTLQLRPGRRFYAGSEVAGGIITAYHESGKLLLQGSTYRNNTATLPKGKTTFYRDLRGPDRSLLEREQDRPLAYSVKLEKPKALELFESMREVMQGKRASSVDLKAGRNHELMVGAPGIASLSAHKPAPDYFSGSFKLKEADGERRELFEIRVECRPGAEFKSVANQKPKPASRETKKSSLEKLGDDLFERRLAFVRASQSSTDPDEQAKRDELIKGLMAEQPKNADLHLARATILARQASLLSDLPKKEATDQAPARKKKAPGKKKGKKKSNPAKPVLAALAKARALSSPADVAAYFGARSEPDEATLDEKKEATEKQKRMDEKRKRLANIARLEADVMLNSGKLKGARQRLTEARRWEDQPSKDYQKVELALLQAEGHDALALQKVNAQLKDSPFDKKLLGKKLELQEKLGFDERFNRRLRLQQKMRDHRLALPQ